MIYRITHGGSRPAAILIGCLALIIAGPRGDAAAEIALSKKANEKQWSPTENEGWKAVDLGDLLVKPGSALDFSALVGSGPAGKNGFVRIDPEGRLVFEGDPQNPVRFLSASECMEWWPVETPEEIREYARQVRLNGYNCFRPHFLDDMLMVGSSEDNVLNPQQLDRWDRLSAELRAQGVYLYFDISTSQDSFYARPSRGKQQAGSQGPPLLGSGCPDALGQGNAAAFGAR